MNISKMEVMKARCLTCPFGNKGERDRSPHTADKVRARVITSASQICHHPRLSGKKQTHLCRGARDYQLTIFHRLGVITEPTDVAWKQQQNSLLNKRSNE